VLELCVLCWSKATHPHWICTHAKFAPAARPHTFEGGREKGYRRLALGTPLHYRRREREAASACARATRVGGGRGVGAWLRRGASWCGAEMPRWGEGARNERRPLDSSLGFLCGDQYAMHAYRYHVTDMRRLVPWIPS